MNKPASLEAIHLIFNPNIKEKILEGKFYGVNFKKSISGFFPSTAPSGKRSSCRRATQTARMGGWTSRGRTWRSFVNCTLLRGDRSRLCVRSFIFVIKVCHFCFISIFTFANKLITNSWTINFVLPFLLNVMIYTIL